MSKEIQIEEMASILNNSDPHYECMDVRCKDCEFFFIEKNCYGAKALYNAGYRKQDDEELIDKIATYFEKEDNWTKLKYAWNGCGKSVQLRDMLRDAITEAKMKGGAE